MFWKKKQTNKDAETETELGDGKAEFLGVGTYEEYSKETEEELAWSELLRKLLKL